MRFRAVGPALMLLAVLAAPAAATAASPGAAGLGDRLAPGLGNGGYDVLHYNSTCAMPPARRRSRSTGP